MATRGPDAQPDLCDPSLTWGWGCGRGGDHLLHFVREKVKKEGKLPVLTVSCGLIPGAAAPPTRSCTSQP